MDKKIILGFFVFILLAGLVSATTDTIGGTDNNVNNHCDWVWANPITATDTGTLQSIGINLYSGGNGQITVAIYTDSGGQPSALLGNSILITSSTGWDDLSVGGSVAINSGTTYWLSFQAESCSDYFYTNTGGTRAYKGPTGIISFPNPFSETAQGSSETFNLRMTYAPASTTSTSTSTSTTTSTSTSTSTTSSLTTTSTTTSTTLSTTSSSTSLTTSSTSLSTSTSTATTSTSTIPTGITPVENASNQSKTNLAIAIVPSIAMPIFPYLMVFVLTGIVAFSTRRGDITCFSGTVTSALLYLVYNTYLSIQLTGMILLAGVLGLLTALAVWERQFRGRSSRNKEDENTTLGFEK